MNDRQPPRTDAEIIERTGIRAADHDYSTPLDYQRLRQQILGRPVRRGTDEEEQARVRRLFGFR